MTVFSSLIISLLIARTQNKRGAYSMKYETLESMMFAIKTIIMIDNYELWQIITKL